MKKLIFGLLIFVNALYACKSSTSAEEETESAISGDVVTLSPEQLKNTGLTTALPESKLIPTTIRLSGRIDVPPQNIVSVSIPLGGYLKSASLLPGSPVKKGQIIAMLEDQQYIQVQQDYLVTKSRLVLAELEKQRQQDLNRQKAASDKAVQLADAEVTALRIGLSALAEKLRLLGLNPQRLNEKNISRQLPIRSPINGFVSKVNGNVGSYIAPSDVLFELVDPANVHLSLTVFENDLSKLSIGQTAIAYSNTQPERKFETKISLISRDLGPDRSAEVHCHFEQLDKTLTPGMFMNADVLVNRDEAQTVPEKSVVSFEGKSYLFTRVNDNTFKMVQVETGAASDGYIVLRDKKVKEPVVVDGAYALLMQLKNTGE